MRWDEELGAGSIGWDGEGNMTITKNVFILVLLSLFFLILICGCTNNDVKFIDVKKFEDPNVTYSNFSCRTDTKNAIIPEYIHSCSFDVIDKNADERSLIDIQYSYCPPIKPCYKEESFTLTNFRPGELYHYEFNFNDHLVNRLLTTNPSFNFKATRPKFVDL